MEQKSKRIRIGVDPMRRFEKVVITTRNIEHHKINSRERVEKYINTFSQTFFKGRLISQEAHEMIKDAKAHGIRIPENISHL
jgi:hypothetical protein